MAMGIDNYGAFHIVVDDMNVEDENVQFCISSPAATAQEIKFGNLLLTMTEDERMSALALAEGFWSMSLA